MDFILCNDCLNTGQLNKMVFLMNINISLSGYCLSKKEIQIMVFSSYLREMKISCELVVIKTHELIMLCDTIGCIHNFKGRFLRSQVFLLDQIIKDILTNT